MLQILSQKDFMDMTVAEKVSVQILSTDENAPHQPQGAQAHRKKSGCTTRF
jgi:hypothetical protein